MCKDSMTWVDIDSYCRVRDVKLSQIEVDYILKCNAWANTQISEMKKDE